jgi:hypothetical protein
MFVADLQGMKERKKIFRPVLITELPRGRRKKVVETSSLKLLVYEDLSY